MNSDALCLGGGWVVTSEGWIRKPDGYWSKDSSWEFLGLDIRHSNLFGHSFFVSRAELFDDWECCKPQLFYKNGKPRFRIVDSDNGTRRVWGERFYAVIMMRDYDTNGKLFITGPHINPRGVV